MVGRRRWPQERLITRLPVLSAPKRNCHDPFRELCEGTLDASGPSWCVVCYPDANLGRRAAELSAAAPFWTARLMPGTKRGPRFARRSMTLAEMLARTCSPESLGTFMQAAGLLQHSPRAAVSPARGGIGSSASAVGRGPTLDGPSSQIGLPRDGVRPPLQSACAAFLPRFQPPTMTPNWSEPPSGIAAAGGSMARRRVRQPPGPGGRALRCACRRDTTPRRHSHAGWIAASAEHRHPGPWPISHLDHVRIAASAAPGVNRYY